MFGFFVNFSFRLCYNKCMDQNKVNPFSENPASSAGSAPAPQSSPNVPVNPYAPAGAPYAPGSNTPPPDYAITSGDAPAVPNTAPRFSTPEPAFTSVPNNYPSAGPEKPKFFTKKFVILASAGVVLILAAVITGIILQNNRKNQGSTVTISASSEGEAVTKLSNLLIQNKDSIDNPNFNQETWYIQEIFDFYEDRYSIVGDYFTKLTKLSSYITNDNIIKNDIKALADYFLVNHYEENLLSTYIKSGQNAAETYISTTLGGAEVKNGNQTIAEYVLSQLRSYLEQKLQLFNTYKESGCISNGSLMDTCIEQFSSTDNSINALKFTMRGNIQTTIDEVKANIEGLYARETQV